MREHEEDGAAFCFCRTFKRQQVLQWICERFPDGRRMRLHAKFLRLPLRSARPNDMARVTSILTPEAVCLFRELTRNKNKPWTDALERLARATAKASEGDITFTDAVRERYQWR
jgi:hypothetical protein